MISSTQTILICRFLKMWRIERGIKQETVYFATGIDISNYDSLRHEPGLSKFREICRFYGLSAGWLWQLSDDVMDGRIGEEEFFNRARRIPNTK